MPLFICEKCGAIENTALGYYWPARYCKEPALCSECYTGEWHGRFEKEYYKDLSKEDKEDYDLINELNYLNSHEIHK